MSGGYYQYYTTTYLEVVGGITKTETKTSFIYVGETTTSTCSKSQNPCGSVCCDSGFYCRSDGQCGLIGGGSSGGITLPPPTPPSILPPTPSLPFLSAARSSATDITTTSRTSIPTASPSTNGLSTGAKAGIGVGAVLGAAALFGLAFWLGWILRKRRRSPVDLSHDLPIGETEAKHNTHSMWESNQATYMGPEDIPRAMGNHELDGRQVPAEAGH